MPIFESKGQPPIAAYVNGPGSRATALERVKAEARDIHILDRRRRVQSGQLHPKLLSVICLYAGGVAGFEETPQAFVTNGLDHKSRLSDRCAMRNTPRCG